VSAGRSSLNTSAELCCGVAGVRQHTMDQSFYEQVHDPDDYNVGIRVRRRTRGGGGWSAQIDAEGKQRRV
jgi:hypothetical protein